LYGGSGDGRRRVLLLLAMSCGTKKTSELFLFI
jgi:hypothetical protein